MKRLFSTALLAGCLASLAACAVAPVAVPGTGPISSGTGTAAKVVRGAQTVCGFAPDPAAVAQILGASDNATIDAVARAICGAVAPLASGPGLEHVRQGYAYGVKVRGRFVR